MKKTSLRFVAVACATLALATAGQAFAHRDGGHGHHTPPTAAQVAERLASVKGELKITANQEGAWQQFETTVRSQAAEREKFHAQMAERQKAGTPPDDKAREAMRAQFQAARDARTKAREALYAVLTPEQKTLADKKLRHGGKDGHHGGHSRHGDHRGPDGKGAPAPKSQS